jgi:hypothetical protein
MVYRLPPKSKRKKLIKIREYRGIEMLELLNFFKELFPTFGGSLLIAAVFFLWFYFYMGEDAENPFTSSERKN